MNVLSASSGRQFQPEEVINRAGLVDVAGANYRVI